MRTSVELSLDGHDGARELGETESHEFVVNPHILFLGRIHDDDLQGPGVGGTVGGNVQRVTSPSPEL